MTARGIAGSTCSWRGHPLLAPGAPRGVGSCAPLVLAHVPVGVTLARHVHEHSWMKIAFATTDGEHVQGELRRSPLVVVYEVTPGGSQLERASAFRERVRSEDRIRALTGSAIVYVAAIGPSTAARLAARGIRPATAPEGTPIRDLLAVAARSLVAPDGELAFA